MKKYFKTYDGTEGMTIDCGTYEVEILKSENDCYRIIKYIQKITRNQKNIPAWFYIHWDDEQDGGRLEIKFKDQWGSQMVFIHYMPSDLKGMFDFIGKGYNVFDEKFPYK